MRDLQEMGTFNFVENLLRDRGIRIRVGTTLTGVFGHGR